MSDNMLNDQKNPRIDESSEEVKKDFKGLLWSVRKFLSDLLEIRSNTDPVATKDSIIADIPFKGHTSWILVCSIFIASVGLNANSTAVVIGAMLISPLMGPILGMGMSLAINDIDTLRRSLKNFAVMVVLSVLTAYLFFALFPLRDESSELLARTAPDIRDVLIAFFGGLALVVARAKKGTIASVIFGVAIATALMPPLCTVGFGLAIGKPLYAAGAMYLFTINTIFIGLATFLVIKYLRFPMVRYANSKRRRLIARGASLVGLAVMIPAGITFYDVLQESLFKKQAQQFLADTVEIYEFTGNGRYENDLTDVHYDPKQGSFLEIAILGTENIPQNIIDSWRNKKNTYGRLEDAELRVLHGGNDDAVQKFKYVNELYESKKAELINKDERIRLLEEEISNLSRYALKNIPFKEISQETRANYENLASFGFANRIETNFDKTDTITIFEVKWKPNLATGQIQTEQEKLTNWLKIRLQDSTLVVKQIED
ncbi:MAG: DUF389 domain-containing protein [Croceitalea sp.]|nr:DUF389 domain-containing protein [Croceitalea sp.]